MLQALRNFFTHDSAESAQRLTVAIRLGCCSFLLNGVIHLCL